MHIRPIGRKLYVVLDKVEERKTEGGIYMPDKHSELVRLGTVKGVGAEVKEIKPGDRILIGFHVGDVLDTPALFPSGQQDTHRILDQSEVMAVVSED